MPHRCARASAFSFALLASCGGGSLRERGDFTHPKDATLRMNQLQALATHNSYRVRTLPTDIPDWKYSHPPIGQQLAEHGVRALEIDVHWNEETGAFDVVHIPLVDAETSCATLALCLAEVRSFSDANPGHHPIFVQFELKWPTLAYLEDRHLAALEAELHAAFPEEIVVTPRDVRGTSATLREAVTGTGWPTLGEVRGRTMFLFDCDREVCLRYVGTDTNLDAHWIFPDSEAGDAFEAVKIHNSADAAATTLVQQGFIVRVFGDGITDVLAGTADFAPALATGAQLVSSDVVAPRTDTSYVASILGGTPSRCNPILAPLDCVSTDVEDPGLLRGR